ncbi:MAG TPA: hypothetical protein VMV23_06040 [Candidatus Nanopelagicaceae bacterium]|nr:hypothetical protein [Candidatus Nanopelagicaceae bacterium]
MGWLLHGRRIYLALLSGALFLLALGISWGLAGSHLWLQAVAMALAALALVIAAIAARPTTRGPQ